MEIKSTKNLYFKLISSTSRDDFLDCFVDMKVSEMKEHLPYASLLGVEDKYCEDYDEHKALSSVSEYETYIICSMDYDEYILGFVQISDYPYFNGRSGVKIENLFIQPSLRNKGIATNVISYLKDLFGSVTLEVYYNLPALKLYKNLGFKEVGKILLLQ